MQATADHLSLETCKLLKDCGVESSMWWHYFEAEELDVAGSCEIGMSGSGQFTETGWLVLDQLESDDAIPCYTWSDVLWKHADKFFGTYYAMSLTETILYWLQKGEYDYADNSVRQHCILIPKS